MYTHILYLLLDQQQQSSEIEIFQASSVRIMVSVGMMTSAPSIHDYYLSQAISYLSIYIICKIYIYIYLI